MAEPPQKPAAPKLSLYPELLQAERATISAAPVRYDTQQQKADEAATKKKKDASLQFQPIKRPQPQQKKKHQQPKPGFPPTSSSSHKFSSSVTNASASSPPNSVTRSKPTFQRITFDDWVAAAEEDDDAYYDDRPRPQRGGKNKKKKNKGQEVEIWDWDDIYDPTRPNVFHDYKGSDEQHREVKEWKMRLHHHEVKAARKANKGPSMKQSNDARPTNPMFAPPSQQLNFAPPSYNDPTPSQSMDEDDDYYQSGPAASTSRPDDATGEDAYLRRMRMSGVASSQSPPVSSPPKAPSVPTPPVIPASDTAASDPAGKSQEDKISEAMSRIRAVAAERLKTPGSNPEAYKVIAGDSAPKTPKLSNAPEPAPIPPPGPPPRQEPGVVASREPVRYEDSRYKVDTNHTLSVPEGYDTMDMMQEVKNADGSVTLKDGRSNAEDAQSNRPTKKGFGERLLKKYGWEKGQGLGAQGEGITTALIAQADKRKKRSDAQGGGWAAPANMGKIVGGKRRKLDDDSNSTDHTTNLSSVVKLEGMLVGLDVQKEIEDNNLMQEIGDEMGNNYGTVERLFIWREEQGGANEVFVKFTSQLSALRAKDGMDGVTFADNKVRASFWSEEKFESAEYGS